MIDSLVGTEINYDQLNWWTDTCSFVLGHCFDCLLLGHAEQLHRPFMVCFIAKSSPKKRTKVTDE